MNWISLKQKPDYTKYGIKIKRDSIYLKNILKWKIIIV